MASNRDLHILFFPFMAPGHMIPMIDMAKIVAARGVKATIVTTHGNAPLVRLSIDQANKLGNQHSIQLCLIPFPTTTALPKGCENMSSIPKRLGADFMAATSMLREPLERVLRDLRPDCIVTDAFFPWTCDVGSNLGIPRLVFNGSNNFSECASYSIDRNKTLQDLPEEAESFVIPDLPHTIRMLKSQIPDYTKSQPFLLDYLNEIRESKSKSYGVVVNSFYELEPDYVEYYKNVVGRKAWQIGPMSLCNEDAADKSLRGSISTIDEDVYTKWLDSKTPGSVVYVCFGSVSEITVTQLHQLAAGLDASDHPFMWVVREGGEESIPDGYEDRVKGKGMVVRGFAPQILILNHASVGGLVTHCGWNSSLEGICAGLPLITWPLSAEQFYNERLLVDVLKIGIGIGAEKFTLQPEERKIVEAAKIEKAVKELMGESEEAKERKRRAKELGELAKKAVKEGGSSYVDLSNLIQELEEIGKNSLRKL